MHGGKQQDQREVSIKGFRDDTFNVLIATDVAGRGIDVPDVALVSGVAGFTPGVAGFKNLPLGWMDVWWNRPFSKMIILSA